jgi:hypothetical protein
LCCRTQFARQGFAFRFQHIAHNHLRAFRDQQAGFRGTLAARRAGNQNNLAIEAYHFVPPSRLWSMAFRRGGVKRPGAIAGRADLSCYDTQIRRLAASELGKYQSSSRGSVNHDRGAIPIRRCRC